MNIGKLDSLGRAKLGRVILSALGWEAGRELAAEISDDGQSVIVHLSRDICAHCGMSNIHSLVQVSAESSICLDCLSKARRSLKNEAAIPSLNTEQGVKY